eukprot:scaffold451576_cov47-Prasinocladus_malaysianus.AAC.1
MTHLAVTVGVKGIHEALAAPLDEGCVGVRVGQVVAHHGLHLVWLGIAQAERTCTAQHEAQKVSRHLAYTQIDPRADDTFKLRHVRVCVPCVSPPRSETEAVEPA